MEEQRSLGEALFPKVKRQLLARFFVSAESRYYGREVARMIEGSHGSVRRELKSLVMAGILATERVGRHQYYWADPDCMIYSELMSIVTKTFGVADLIGAALLPMEIEIAMLFGSVAGGADTARSDIDLLVITSLSFRELVFALDETERKLGRAINPVVISRDDFREKVQSQNHFVLSVLEAEHVFVKGNADDLGKLAGQRLA